MTLILKEMNVGFEREGENMEGVANSSRTSCMMGFEGNHIMIPLMNSGVEANSKLFLPLPLSDNSFGQKTSALMSEEDYGNRMEANDICMRAKIMDHPLFPRLLAAYVNCQKVGAPPEVLARLEDAYANFEAAMGGRPRSVCIGQDPGLDQFMEAYCEMLSKYEQELSKPFKEAMLFFSRIEYQLKALTVSSSESGGRSGSSEEEVDVNDKVIDPQVEDQELKVQLLRKYSGYLGSLKKEFLKKKKNGKLPKEARQQLLDWWSRHYKWPYPSESQKVALAESTGLDLKQINNWFINQRKRHWNPSEDMQFVVMDATHPHYFMDNVMCNPLPMDCTSMLL